jgi:sugar/nucleoside kinase (ribokinase family)
LPHDCQKELQAFLKRDFNDIHVVVMPDFFLDRIVTLEYNAKIFCRNIEKVTTTKGGSIDRIKQADLRGGNAINTASALTALGVKVTPIVCTNKLGFQLIKHHINSHNVDLSHIKIVKKASITTAIELKTTKEEKVNVMLRDVGSLRDFGPENLSDEDFRTMENADYVCIFNWAGTRRFGTQLAKIVFDHVKRKGKTKTYCDTADPSPNAKKIPELVKKVLKSENMDVLSCNENEAVCYASQLSNEIRKKRNNLKLEELAKESARTLTSGLSARVDLHTTRFSATFKEKNETVAPAFRAPVLRVTGAGDAWNAGNIVADAHGLSDECRLALANAVAAYYISSPAGNHPTRKQLAQFCAKLKPV